MQERLSEGSRRMKSHASLILIPTLILLLALASACKEETTEPVTHARPNPNVGKTESVARVPLTIIQTDEQKDRKTIKEKAAALLAAGDLVALERMAQDYRQSKACYADGMWKLKQVYEGLVLERKSTDREWTNRLAVLGNWTRTQPKSTTARVALAQALIDYGWAARGTGFAPTVTDQGWKLFGERLTQAAQVLHDAENLEEKCPRLWSAWLTIAMGMGAEKSDYEALFQKATAAEPGFAGYYIQKAMYLLPRWHGKAKDTARFLESAANSLGGEAGDVLYAQVAWSLQGVEGNIFDTDACGLSWPRTERGFVVLERRYPNSPFVQNAHAYLAVMGSDRFSVPRRLVDRLQGRLDPEAWTSKDNFVRLTKSLYER